MAPQIANEKNITMSYSSVKLTATDSMNLHITLLYKGDFYEDGF